MSKFREFLRGLRPPKPKFKLSHFLPGYPPRKVKPKLEYWVESDLPDDPEEMIHTGAIRPWRVEAQSGRRWYTAEPGAVRWYVEGFVEGGSHNE